MIESVCAIRNAVRSGRVSAREVVGEALARAEKTHQTLNAFIELFHEKALAHAGVVDERVRTNPDTLPLAGVPIAIKNNIALGPDEKPGDGRGYGGRTTCASRILEDYRSPFSATAAERLTRAGAIIVGSTNMDEFGMGSSGEYSAFGATRHPLDPTRVPGGSSSGSAAAVAAECVAGALGSDTGGSIRQPAAFCGLVGVKPTYGRVSRYGLVAYASSLDQIGPLARNVEDAAAILEVISGEDPLDATSSTHDVPMWSRELSGMPRGVRVGVPRQVRENPDHPAVRQALEESMRELVGVGAAIVDVDMPMLAHAIAAYYIVATAEASSNLSRYDGIRFGLRREPAPGEGLLELYSRTRGEGFGPEVKRRIMLGTHVLSGGYAEQYYLTALKVRRRLLHDFEQAFAHCDVILMPTTPGPAFKIGEKTADPLAMYLEDLYTVGVNLAGLPAISLPAGYAHEPGTRLPVGVQFIAPPFEETRLFQTAHALERAMRR